MRDLLVVSSLDQYPLEDESLIGGLVTPGHDLDVSSFEPYDDDAPEDTWYDGLYQNRVGAPSYYLAESLSELWDETNNLFPNRDHSSDGWIGDASHQARPSDHNPDWSSNGVVRALDLDVDDGDPKRNFRRMLLEEVIGDPRVWYVISNRIIYSDTYDWEAREYNGSNPHDKHVHISIKHTLAAENDTSPWFGPNRPKRRRRSPIDLSVVREMFLRAIDERRGPVEYRAAVRRVQKRLNHKYGLSLATDGFVGKDTLNAWGRHERGDKHGRPRIPDAKSLHELVRKSHYRMVA